MTKRQKAARRTGFLGRFARHSGGLAAVEMALLAPIMIAGYFGLTEVTMAMMANRRANHAVATVGDLVTQTTQIDAATMTDIFTIGTAMMRPFSASSLNMRVTSVQMDADRNVNVVWSKTSGSMTALSGKVVDAKLTDLMSPWESIVIAEMSYSYDSPFQQAIPQALTFKDTVYLRPRRSDQVVWTGP